MLRVAVADPYPLVRAGLERVVDEHPALVHADGAADVTVGEDLVLLDAPSGDAVAEALRAGARGVVPRRSEPADVARAIEVVGAGATLVAGELVPALVAHLVGAASPPFPQLTARERDVLDGVAAGATNGQIAQALGLATKTVRNHVASIATKLQVLDRAQLAMTAREAGLGGRPRA